jgi:hypothetical protein
MVFLDSSIVIYYVEQPATWGQKASDRLTSLRASGEQFAVTELVRMECLVGPIKGGDAAMLADFAAFFSAPEVLIRALNYRPRRSSKASSPRRYALRFARTTHSAEDP